MRFTFGRALLTMNGVSIYGVEEKAFPTAKGPGADTAGAGRGPKGLSPGRVKIGGGNGSPLAGKPDSPEQSIRCDTGIPDS